MEGDIDMDVFDKGDDYGVDEGDEETSFIDVDEGYYDKFSRASESDRMGHYDWGSPEQYEAARSKYEREHGASNIPSWDDLPDRDIDPLFEEDPLTTIEGAQERILELEPNTNLDEIKLSKKDGKIYIRVLNQKSGKWTVAEQLFTKDGEIRAKVRSYEGFKEATRNRLQELEELNRRVDVLKEMEELQKELEESKKQNIKTAEERDNLRAELDNLLKTYDNIATEWDEERADLNDTLEQQHHKIAQIKELQTTIEELKEDKIEAEEFYERQNLLYMDSLRMERANTQERITELLNSKNEAKSKLKSVTQTLEKTQHELATVRSKFDKQLGEITNDLSRVKGDRDKLQQEVKIKEEQLRQVKQSLEDLEQQAERLKEKIAYETRSEEEREAAEQQLRAIEERILELEEQEKNLERVLGLTRREKILRYLKQAGLGIGVAGAIASIVSLIMNILDKTGAAAKKVGGKVADTGKKMAAAMPGLIGSVLSLVFRTGGELLKFLGNNIWILVVALGAVILKSLTEKSSRSSS